MKSKEEIEQSANEYAKQFDYAEDSSPFLDYIEGYTQCQEDMKQKLEQFYNHGKWAIIEHGHGDTFEDYYNRIFKQH